MKNNRRLNSCVLLSAILASLVMPFIQPATPAHAWTPQTWDTQADFDAGLLNNVDTSSSPNNVLLASSVDVGDGSDGALTVNGFYLIDQVRAPVTATSPIGSAYLTVGPTAGLGFAPGQEVLAIQMTGTGAGTWETTYIAGVEPTLLVFTDPLTHAYYADTNSQAQVIKVPHFTNVTVTSGGLMQCHPWYPSGPTGGVIFFRANGTVTVNGIIDASGAGFIGGQGGTQGGASGGMGGQKGNINHGFGWDGGFNSGSNTGGAGGQGGLGMMHGWWGGTGGFQGYGGQSGQAGSAGSGPDGGLSDHGGTNGSTPNLSLMQSGGGGGGGSSGIQGYGGGGGGGGGLNACVMIIGVKDGAGGSSGGNPGTGGPGGLGGGIIGIHAGNIVAGQAMSIKSTGQYGQAGTNGGSGGNGGAGGYAENMCVVIIDGTEQDCGAGGGGGGGGGGQGGGGGNGGAGGGGGVIWLAANNISLAANGANAMGAPGAAAGQGGSGGAGGAGGAGGSGDDLTYGHNGSNGPTGAAGNNGNTGGQGGGGAIRLDYASMTGSTTPAPGYTSGVYFNSGSIASNVWDTGAPGQVWTYLDWQETLAAGTDITFEARASDTSFAKNDNTVPWVSVGGASPVTSGLPSGRYMQWRATLTTNNKFYTPVLHSVTAAASLGPLVTTNAATFVDSSGAALHGTLNSLGQSSSTVYVNFSWGTHTGGPYDYQTTPQPMTAPVAYAAGLTGLSPGTTYYFKARANDLVNPPVLGDELSFTTTPIAPSVTTNPATSITAGSAVLNGYLNSLGASLSVNSSFQWGTTQGGPYPNSTAAQAMGTAGPFQAGLSNLGSGTTYYYRAKADGGVNGTNYGAEMSFTTVRILPLVATGNASSVTSSSATLNGSLANLGAASTVNVSYQWGTTSGGPYPNSTPAQAMNAQGPFSAGLTGLSAKTTYYFRAKGDGGASGVSYGSENSFTTAVVQPSVATIGATGITGYSALLNGDLSAMGTAATVDVTFYYGLQPGDLNHTAWQTMSAPGTFQATLTGLTPDTVYYFRTAAQGDGSAVSGAELTFRTSTVPPAVTTNGVTLVTAATARLNGTLTAVGSAASDNVSFQWGTTSGMYSWETAPQTMSATGNFTADLAGLTSGTTYYYRAKANGGIDGIAYGAEHSFTTNTTPPSVTTANASQVTTNSAALNGNLDGLGTAASVNVSFQWGTTRGGPYSNSTAPQALSTPGAFQAGLTGLTSFTTYYYRAKADGGAFGTAYGAEKSFSTSSFPPHVATGSAVNIAATTATLNGNLYFLGSAVTVNVSFLYGTTSGGPYPFATAPQGMAAPGSFQADLTGLSSNTTYYFRARGDGGQYGISTGQEQRFTTSSVPPSVVTNDAGGVTASAATLNGNLTDLNTATTVNVSFQYGTTAGGPYPYSTAPQAKTAAGAFTAGISGLDAGTAYYCRAVADGGNYGISYGAEKSFTTSTIPPSVITDNATSITASTATLNGSLTSPGTAGTVNAYFNWGTTHGGPYPNSTTPQAMTAGGPFRANISGLTALTTYYFIAAADGDGSTLGAECSFTTGAVPPSVSTGAATLVTGTSATLNGTLQAMGTSPSDNVSFQWGTRPGVYSRQTDLQPFAAPGDFTAPLAGLSGNTTYYYRAVASGGRSGTSFGVEHAFTTSTIPPTATTGATTDWTTNTAFLNGNLTVKGTASTVNVSFIYGTSAGGPYPFTTPPQAKTSTGSFQAGITGLSPYTRYYFKARADGGVYGTSYGSELNFTTNRLPPVMGTGGAIDVMTNAAILDGNLYLMGSASTVNVLFECGTSPGTYTWETAPQPMTAPGAYQAQLLWLSPNTTYYYRAKGNGGVHGTGYGEERSFTTGSHPPIVATGAATAITAGGATLNGDLLNRGSAASANVRFEYGTTQGGPYFNATQPQPKASAGTFNADLTGLNPLTVYYYRARADGGIYGTSFGAEQSFVTSNLPPSVTTVDASSITTDSAVVNGDLVSLGRAATVNVSFLWGTIRGGPYAGATAPQAMTSAGAFRAYLTGLSPDMTYYYMAKAEGGIYGTVLGLEKSFSTVTIPPPPPQPPRPGSSGGLTSAIPPIQTVSLPNVVVQSASLSAAAVRPGDPVTVTVSVANRGTVNGKTVVRLYVDGQEEAVQGISLESGKTRSITFTTARSRPGTYTVYVGGIQAGSFTVAEYIDPAVILFISMALVLTALALGLVYVWRRRQQEY